MNKKLFVLFHILILALSSAYIPFMRLAGSYADKNFDLIPVLALKISVPLVLGVLYALAERMEQQDTEKNEPLLLIFAAVHFVVMYLIFRSFFDFSLFNFLAASFLITKFIGQMVCRKRAD